MEPFGKRNRLFLCSIFFNRQRVKFVKNLADYKIDGTADKAAERVCDQVVCVAAAAFYKALVEFIGAAVGECKARDNQDLEPGLCGPFCACPEHCVAAGKRCVFASVRELIPNMRETFKFCRCHGRYFEDDGHAKDCRDSAEGRVLLE